MFEGEECNPAVPHTAHETDCKLFYHCFTGFYGNPPIKVLKECGPGTLFNPKTMICDWEDSVVNIKPECGKEICECLRSFK